MLVAPRLQLLRGRRRRCGLLAVRADGRGARQARGGDSFFVAIRGPSQVRARVLDNDDGSYLVVWKPTVSGAYTITISHFGITLPGVPFVVQASTNQPCASRCSAFGDALRAEGLVRDDAPLDNAPAARLSNAEEQVLPSG